jgi:hypothetical protein
LVDEDICSVLLFFSVGSPNIFNLEWLGNNLVLSRRTVRALTFWLFHFIF